MSPSSIHRLGSWMADRLRRRVVLYPAVLILFTAITMVIFADLIVDLNGRFLWNFSDASNSISYYSAIEQQGSNPFQSSRDLVDGAPEGLPIPSATNIAAPLQTIAIWGLKDVFGLQATFNLGMLLGYVLTGFAAFVLLDRLRVHPLAALFGAYVIAFNPWMIYKARDGHIAFTQGWALLLVIGAGIWMIRTRRVMAGVALGSAVGLTFWVASYWGLLGSVIAAVALAYDLVVVRPRIEKLWTATLACAAVGVASLFFWFLGLWRTCPRNRPSTGHSTTRQAKCSRARRVLRRISCPRPVIHFVGDVFDKSPSNAAPPSTSRPCFSATRPICWPRLRCYAGVADCSIHKFTDWQRDSSAFSRRLPSTSLYPARYISGLGAFRHHHSFWSRDELLPLLCRFGYVVESRSPYWRRSACTDSSNATGDEVSKSAVRRSCWWCLNSSTAGCRLAVEPSSCVRHVARQGAAGNRRQLSGTDGFRQGSPARPARVLLPAFSQAPPLHDLRWRFWRHP